MFLSATVSFANNLGVYTYIHDIFAKFGWQEWLADKFHLAADDMHISFPEDNQEDQAAFRISLLLKKHDIKTVGCPINFAKIKALNVASKGQ